MSVNTVDSSGNLLRVAGGTLYADLPIGSWVKNDSDTIPNGFLKAGDTISQALYPELYTMYGSTVPYKADTSELSDAEKVDGTGESGFILDTTNHECPYDGFITLGHTAPHGRVLSINDVQVVISGNSGGAASTTYPVKKGEFVKVDASIPNTDMRVCNARFYKKSLIVKAKQVAVPFDVAEYIRNQNVLSDIESISLPTAAAITMEYDGFIGYTGKVNTPTYVTIVINDTSYANAGETTTSSVLLPIFKGDKVYAPTISGASTIARFYKLRDYTGR